MPYCTGQDLIDNFGEAELIQLTDNAGTGVINADALNKAIGRADSKIDRYLAGRSDLPLLAGSVVDLACDIARYYLHATSVPDLVKDRFNDAVKELRQMAAREIAVVDAGGNENPTSAAVVMVTAPSIFGRTCDY